MSTPQRKRRRARRLGWALAVLFGLAIVMGTGPGILLVNRPEALSLGGVKLPYLYAWGLLWYLVEALCVLLACFVVWRRADGD